MIQMNLLTKQKETHRLRKQTHGCHGEGIVKDFGKVMYTMLYLKQITNKNLLYTHGTLLNVMCQPGQRGIRGRMDICIHMAEFLHCSPETITILLIGYIPIQNVFGIKERERESAWFINQKRLKLKKETPSL